MINKNLVLKLSKAMYVFGIVFLLTGMLLSAVNLPAQAQDVPPAKAETFNAKLNLSHILCTADNLVEIHFIVNGLPDGHTPKDVTYTTSTGLTNTVSLEKHTGSAWHYTDYQTPGYYDIVSASVQVKYKKDGVWKFYTLNLHNPGDYKGDYCSPEPEPEAELSLAPKCPDYENSNNVWALHNNGDAPTSYTCIGCSDSGPGTIAAGETIILKGVRSDGSENITVNFGDSKTAGGDNTGITDEEALKLQCDVPHPALEVSVTLDKVDCGYAYFNVVVTNTGYADAQDVALEYSATGTSAGIPNPTSTNVGVLGAGNSTDPIAVMVPVTWTSENTSEFIELTAMGKIGSDVMASDSDKAYNPGTCFTSDLVVNVVTITEGCEETVFEITVTNHGTGTANGVVLHYTASGDHVNGNPDPLSTEVGSVAPNGGTAGPFTVKVPVDWNNSDDFGIFIKLAADAMIGEELLASDYDVAHNKGECFVSEPMIKLTADDVAFCEIESAEACVTFYLSISNLPEGSVVTVGSEEFTADGNYEVVICDEWPGIGLGFDYTEFEISAEALLDGEKIEDASALVFYDPEENQCELPKADLLFQDPFCYVVDGEFKMAWRVDNPTDFDIDFGWTLDGGAIQVGNTPARGMAWLGNFDLGRHTVVIFWGQENIDELTMKLSLEDCEGSPPLSPPPPPTPPNTPPVTVVASVEQPGPVVAAGVLIPVTGLNLKDHQENQGFLQKLAFFVGLIFLGFGLIFQSININTRIKISQ